jgi:hypothetical protein
MLTFNNDPALKSALVAEGQRHLAADMLIKGTYGGGAGKNFKACSVGCYFHGSHDEGLTKFQIPKRVTYFADALFEILPEPDNNDWHVAWTEAIPVGVTETQINLVMDRLALFSLRQKSEWYGGEHNHHLKIMISLFDRVTQGDEPRAEEWNRDAWDARAAWDARDARAAWDAWDAWAA